MIIQTSTASFLIQTCQDQKDCITIHSNSEIDLARYFGSLEINKSENHTLPFHVKSCKQEFSDALILMVKEIDYFDFSSVVSVLG
ncbi:hypothetical protein [Algoriphagus sp. CAU 1675]|uniref:hypothetical protein n=1 Tax=Algoriphagus sp. CAU 1675 TaxID=3032597 RepID=UPI0023DB7F49|nr:hypothetical protein [Algoriphagus sp. CAU 1675]MDF2157034.1 hypothetical protein [Algoriphagus sp. CAU 1675]